MFANSRGHIARSLVLVLIAALFAGVAPTVAYAEKAKPEQLDFTPLRHMPVFYKGRVMPLDTFAQLMVEDICQKRRPTLGIKDKGLTYEWDSEQMAEARKLFPDGEDRRFSSIELFYSWLVEPERWEDVPFLLAERDVRELLEVPATNSKGEALKYISPAQFEQAMSENTPYAIRIRELAAQQEEAKARGESPTFGPIDKKVEELYRAWALFHALSISPTLDLTGQKVFERNFSEVAKAWIALAEDLPIFERLEAKPELGEAIRKAQTAARDLLDMTQRRGVETKEILEATNRLVESSDVLARELGEYNAAINKEKPENFSDEQYANARKIMEGIATGAARLHLRAEQLKTGLLENGQLLRVVPAINPAAIDSGRDAETAPDPWLDLASLLHADQRLLEAYPKRHVEDVRRTFTSAAAIYRDRDNPRRAAEFQSALVSFTDSMRRLGEAVEPSRERLAGRDEDLLAHTRYPAAGGSIAAEVRYNTLDPFLRSWIISLVSVTLFALSFGVLRKPMFWLGMLVLGAGVLWTAYGFYLRVMVTRWAPVTNMYETVVFVPFFVAILGMWFALLPLTWPGLRNAWRMTAAPWTPESTELTDEHLGLMSPSAWTSSQFVLMAPRLALTIGVLAVLSLLPYADGGRSIINLLPVSDIAGRGYTFNDLLTWAVGLLVLAFTMWQLPRVVLTFALAPAIIPLSLSRREPGAKPVMPQVYARWPFVFGAALVSFMGTYVAWYSPVLDENFSALQPVLRSNFWLTIHVLTIVASYGAGALAWILGNIALLYYLFGKYQDPVKPHDFGPGHRPADDDFEPAPFHRRPPEQCATLASYVYRAMQVAVLLLVAGTILGGLWADVSWGRFWGWDPKEVWALISGLVYLAILHGRYAGWFGNFGLAIGSILGATAIAMSWYGVNFWLGVGLHAYAFGTGGLNYVISFVLGNWLLIALPAGLRYFYETHKTSPVEQPKEEELASTT